MSAETEELAELIGESDPWQPPAVSSGTVYHYTDPAGLVGIVEHRQLWATEAGGLNDLSEIKRGWKVVARLLAEHIAHDGEDDLLSELLDMAEDRRTAQRERNFTYLLCASLEPDDAAQWRLYGGRRAGYALHLDASQELQVIRRGDKKEPTRGTLRDSRRFILPDLGELINVGPWLLVAYTRPERERLVGSLISWARQRETLYQTQMEHLARKYGSAEESLAAGDHSQVEDARTSDLRDAIATAAALIKPKGFRAEKEVRVIVTARWGSPHALFRANDLGVIRYLRLALPKPESLSPDAHLLEDKLEERTLPVTGVTVGPTPYFNRTKDTLHALLRRVGADRDRTRTFQVRKSGVPLRW